MQKQKACGCRPFDPQMMLNLYIYGYLNRVRSSRRLEAETLRNVEVMWLLEKLTPDDKTIANFRKDNAKALRETFRAFTFVCKDLELIGGKVVAIDGTKIRANNSLDNNFNAERAKRVLERIDKRISEYMNELDKADKEESADGPPPDKEKLRKVLEKLKARKIKIEVAEPRWNDPGGASVVDTDARQMKQYGDSKRIGVCYNIQTAADEKHGIIVGYATTDNSSDLGNLKHMTDEVKEVLGIEKLTALADRGYYKGEDIAACEKAGIECLVAKPERNQNKRSKDLNTAFIFENFTYNSEKDCYICPLGQELSFRSIQKHRGRKRRYYANCAACRVCPERSKCTSGGSRKVVREEYQNTLDIVDARTKNNPALYRKRSKIIEAPNGTVKKIWGFIQFLCRGKVKVDAESALTYTAFNLRRVLTIFKGQNKELIAKIRA